eukprot:TRINITY_DN48216_c0_g1_i1.p1 TRINITY_DN48216_c0_g1~~TRINITY_DN48216_c0_g1_i1.p1  ORF type:complete len:381 (-),score=92.12 TRINITY_DN48216_c0_g1_i1:187-1329(-)
MARYKDTNQQLRIAENEAAIESSFRRLLASVEGEREKIRSTWLEIDGKKAEMTEELRMMRRDTDEWCNAERAKIDEEWAEVDQLRERMTVLMPEASDILQINCSGRFFDLPKSALVAVEGSFLNHMFSDAFIDTVPRDQEGRYFLDFNPVCFGIIVDYLQRRRADGEVPVVPPEQQMNMDLLVEALRLNAFMRKNHIQQVHRTSLRIFENTISALHDGWQVIAGQHPLPMAGNAYFEMRVLRSMGTKGAIAVGVCGHIPQGEEVNAIRIQNSVLYNGGFGLIGDSIASENVQKGIDFVEGSVVGIRHDIFNHSITWYHNKISLGMCTLSAEALQSMHVLYPVFGLHVPDTKIEADFSGHPTMYVPAAGPERTVALRANRK